MYPESSCDPSLSDPAQSKILISQGIAFSLKSPNIPFPYELLALAYSAQGQALLEGFNFYRIQSAATMPDHVPLFGLELENREQLVSLLKGKGLDID
jgi:hypothetical protein